MPVSRLAHIPGIGVDEIGDAADATGNPNLLRLENLDTDVPPPAAARKITRPPSTTMTPTATCRSRATAHCERPRLSMSAP